MDSVRWNITAVCLLFSTIFSSVESQVGSAPSFTDKPNNVTDRLHASVVFKCQATGFPTPTIRWLKFTPDNKETEIKTNGRFIVSAPHGYFYILGVQWSDAGQYGCVAQNEHGRMVANAYLSVITDSPPTWHVKPHNVTLYKGQKYTLSCKTYGFPEPVHAWLKDSHPIWDVDLVTGKDLFFSFARTWHSGEYTCTASNINGLISESAYVKVVSDPSIVIHPENVSVFRGEAISLSCGVVGSTKLSVNWRRNGNDLPDDTLISFKQQTWNNVRIYSLNIEKVRKHHLGQYHCIVANAKGNETSNAAFVSYTGSIKPLQIEVLKPKVIATEGSDVQLMCTFVGNPTPQVTWYKDGQKLGSEGFRETIVLNNKCEAILKLSSVTPSVAGNYVCEGHNIAGKVKENITLIVKGGSVPDVQPANQFKEAKKDSSVNLQFVVVTTAMPDIMWYKDGKQLKSVESTLRPQANGTYSAELVIKSAQYSDGGVYMCKAQNQFGTDSGNVTLVVRGKANSPEQSKDKKSSTGAIVGGVIGGVLLIVLIIVVVLILCRLKRKKKAPSKPAPAVMYTVVDSENNTYDSTYRDATGIPQERQDTYSYVTIKPDATTAMKVGGGGGGEYASVPRPKQWEVPKRNVSLEKTLGSGHFGKVMKGFLKTKQGTQVVAVKMLKENADQQQKKEFLDELELMKTIAPHPNIVGLLGCCTKSDKPLIIVEFCSMGNLRDFLRSSHGSVVYANMAGNSLTLTCRDLLSFAWQCARGMSYLASQKLVHRDLAARNILVDKGHVCKIADFGLARDIYEKKQYLKLGEAELPLRWMAIESIFQGVTTMESDVWSFGILLWEIVTLGANPYPAMSRDQLIEELRSGYRMPKPRFCSDELYSIMWQCWQQDPASRPTFLELGKTLHRLMTAQTLSIDLDNYDRSYINATEEQQ